MTEPDQAQILAQRRAETTALYHAAFSTTDGRAVLADLKEHFDPLAACFSADTSFDPIKAAVRDGQRQVLIHIVAHLERDPEAAVTPLEILTD